MNKAFVLSGLAGVLFLIPLNLLSVAKAEAHDRTTQPLREYRAVCLDGHGVLAPWSSNYDLILQVGMTHKWAKGHDYEIQER
jgi:hypothetical protein